MESNPALGGVIWVNYGTRIETRVGIGAAGYRTYKLRKMEKEQQIIEVAVETAPDESRK